MPLSPMDLVAEAKAQIREITTAEAQAQLAKRVVLDVREPDEYVGGHFPGAINIPRGILEFKIGMIPEAAPKGAPLMLYCRTSGRAALAAVQLARLGYTNVVSVSGGFEAWANEQRPTEKPEPINFG